MIQTVGRLASKPAGSRYRQKQTKGRQRYRETEGRNETDMLTGVQTRAEPTY